MKNALNKKFNYNVISDFVVYAIFTQFFRVEIIPNKKCGSQKYNLKKYNPMKIKINKIKVFKITNNFGQTFVRKCTVLFSILLVHMHISRYILVDYVFRS